MKKLTFAFGLIVTCLCAFGAEKEAKNPLLASDTVVWAGLDYSMVKMIGPGAFNEPAAIFPGMLEKWNNLFLVERLQNVESRTKKRVITDIGGVTEVNKTATPKQITEVPGPDDTIDKSHITPEAIAKAVKGYKLENKSGLGVVFIADRFVKVKKGQGAVYVVAFDVATREVIFAERMVENASGFGFRNYWFGVIKSAESALRKCRG